MTPSLQEQKLRKILREAIRLFFKTKEEKNEIFIKSILEEHTLRTHIRSLLVESAVEDPDADVHDNTGINTLKDLLKNTNVLSTLRGVYKTLTTSSDQRNSFRAHIVRWIQDTLTPIKMNDLAPLDDPGPPDEAIMEALEDGDVDIEVTDADREKFIDAKDGSPEQPAQTEEESEKSDMAAVPGEDTTGRNKAERVYPTIEKSIIDYYAELDHEDDQELFFDYLIANIKLYFDKWESEMSPGVEEPTNDEYQSAQSGVDAPPPQDDFAAVAE